MTFSCLISYIVHPICSVVRFGRLAGLEVLHDSRPRSIQLFLVLLSKCRYSQERVTYLAGLSKRLRALPPPPPRPIPGAVSAPSSHMAQAGNLENNNSGGVTASPVGTSATGSGAGGSPLHAAGSAPSTSLLCRDNLHIEKNVQRFQLPPNEALVKEYDCALARRGGHLFVYQHYLCFYSRFFASRVQLRIELIEISQIDRVSVLFRSQYFDCF